MQIFVSAAELRPGVRLVRENDSFQASKTCLQSKQRMYYS